MGIEDAQCAECFRSDEQVAARGLQGFMAQQNLDGAHVRSRFQGMRGKGV